MSVKPGARARKKKTPYQRQKAKTWSAFSKMIRTRDCLLSTGSLEYGECCTCGKVYEFRRLQAGHYIPGRTNANLFDVQGVHAQCIGCNMYGRGKPQEYHMYMAGRYDEEVLEAMRVKAKKTKKYSLLELKEMEIGYLRMLELMTETERVPEGLDV